MSSAFGKAELLAQNCSKNFNLDGSDISLPAFPSRVNLKLCIIPVNPKLIQKVITRLDSLKPSSPDCIPAVVLKKFKPELSYVLAEIFNMCLKESCFLYC